MPAKKANKFRSSFEAFGITFVDDIDDQLIADCPFTDKPKKLYVNPDTGQWDTKSGGFGGNLYTFLKKFYEMALEHTTPVELQKLAESRSLPIDAFQGEVAFNPMTGKFLIPEYNTKGSLSGISHYKVGKKLVMRTKNTNVTCNGIHNLKAGEDVPVYICEGEWDWFALKHLHYMVGYKSHCVCVPGAGTFKAEWVELFKGKRVFGCYDNDGPGEKGESKMYSALKGKAKSVQFLEWLELYDDGYDTRDFILDNAHPTSPKPRYKACFKTMQNMFTDEPRLKPAPSSTSGSDDEDDFDESTLEVPTLTEIEKGYGKWLKMTDFDPLAYMFGVCFANRISGDPVWGFIVAPPGGSKTEMLITTKTSNSVETVSTLTPASLISGMKMPDGSDPSIIPRLNGRMLVVKDFTTVLTMHAFERDAVFGILRDVYDGSIEKPFGNGLVRKYESLFGMLAGVTPTIDSFQSVHSSLGERFIKYRLDDGITPETEEERLLRVLSNINQENNMRSELQMLGRRVLAKQIDKDNLPTFSDEVAKTVMRCARYTAKLRASIDRDKYTSEMQNIPTTEIATRLTKQYMKLAMGVSIYFDEQEVGENALRVLRKVAVDTAPSMREKVVASIYKYFDEIEEPISTKEIEEEVPFCASTLSGVLKDLTVLGIVKKVKGEERMKSFYKPTKTTIEIIEGAELY